MYRAISFHWDHVVYRAMSVHGIITDRLIKDFYLAEEVCLEHFRCTSKYGETVAFSLHVPVGQVDRFPRKPKKQLLAVASGIPASLPLGSPEGHKKADRGRWNGGRTLNYQVWLKQLLNM